MIDIDRDGRIDRNDEFHLMELMEGDRGFSGEKFEEEDNAAAAMPDEKASSQAQWFAWFGVLFLGAVVVKACIDVAN